MTSNHTQHTLPVVVLNVEAVCRLLVYDPVLKYCLVVKVVKVELQVVNTFSLSCESPGR